MFKRVICVFLIAALFLATSITTIAATDVGLTVIYGTNELSSKAYTKVTKFSGVKQSADGYYAMEVDTNFNKAYVPVGRLDIQLSDAASVNAALARNDIPLEIKSTLQKMHEQAVKTGTTNAVSTLFSSTLLARDTTSTYYTYNGHQMRSDKMFSYGLNTNWNDIEEGVDTEDVAAFVVSVSITAASVASKFVSVLSTGYAVIEAFLDEFGSDFITGSTSDFLAMRLIYDDVKQWTYGKVGDEWSLGLCSQQIRVTRIGSEQYYWSALKEEEKQRSLTERAT